MLRSSSKLVTRARSMRNSTKLPFRFMFDIIIDSVDKIPISGPVVFIWERSQAKVLSTKPVPVDRGTMKASFRNETLSAEVTLYKNSPQDNKFQDKVVKLAVKSGSVEGKTLGKIHLNLASHAELPSGSKKVSAELNNGSTFLGLVQCQFISMGTATPKGSSGGKTLYNDEEDELSLDEFNGDSTADESPPSAPSTKVRISKNKLNITRLGSKKSTVKKGRQSESPNIDGDNDILRNSASTLTGFNNNTGKTGNSASQLDKLRKENTKLRKQLEGGLEGRESRLNEENKKLRREIDSLKESLKRDFQFQQLVNQLKDAKMALAVLQMERDQLALDLMKAADSSSPRTC